MTDLHRRFASRTTRTGTAVVVAFALFALLPAFAVGFAPLAGTLAVDPPTAPAQTSAVPGDKPSLARLSWKASESLLGIEYYEVSVASKADGPFRKAGITTALSFDYTAGLPGTDYYFSVIAFDRVGRQSLPAKVGPVAAEWKQSPHEDLSGTTNTCADCHQTHRATSPALSRSDIGTSAPEPAVRETESCFACHDGRGATADVKDGRSNSFALTSGHSLEMATSGGDLTNQCSSCHDPHADARENRMLIASKVNGVAVRNGSAVCLACHTSAQDWFGDGYPSTSAPRRDAKGYPIAGTWPGATTYAGSTNAHRRIPASTQVVPGGEIGRAAGDCSYCHASHRGASTYDGLVAELRPSSASTLATDQASGAYAAVCLRCHSGAVPSGFTTAPADIERFVTSDSPNAGHRIKTAGGTLPVGAPLPCYECHNPHGSNRGNASMLSDALGGNLTTADDAGVRRYCLSCHTTSDTGAGWNGTEYAAPASGAEIVGIPRTAGLLRLPVVAAHDEASTQSCNDCHGGSYAAAGNNVHDPAVPAAPIDGASTVPDITPLAPSATSDTPTVEPMAGTDCRSCHALANAGLSS